MSITKEDLKEALKQQDKRLNNALKQQDERFAERLVKHFYTKDEIDQKLSQLPTREDLKKTIDLFFKLKKDNKNIIMGNIKPIISYPGTEFFDIALRKGLKIPKNLEEWSKSMYGNFENTNIPWMTKKRSS